MGLILVDRSLCSLVFVGVAGVFALELLFVVLSVVSLVCLPHHVLNTPPWSYYHGRA